jgi:uncharacterized protein YegL
MSEKNVDVGLEFALNPGRRAPCLLLLDDSASMGGAAIKSLNEGLVAFCDELRQDPEALERVECAVITFGTEVRLVQDFIAMSDFLPSLLRAAGPKRLAAGVQQALEHVARRQVLCLQYGVNCYTPWVLLLTNGAVPQNGPDDLTEAAAHIAAARQGGEEVNFMTVGVDDAHKDRLLALDLRAVRLRGLNFCNMFVLVARSAAISSLSGPDAGGQAKLPAVDWDSN